MIGEKEAPVTAEKKPPKIGVKKTGQPKKKEQPEKEEVSEDEKEEGDESIEEREYLLPGVVDENGNVIIAEGVSFCYN